MENFDLRISDHDGYHMHVAVIHSPAGEVTPMKVAAPTYTALDLAEEQDARLRAIAGEFTAQVWPAAVWQAWRESWAAAGESGIRLRIRCADANSMRIPWELLYDAERKNFLAQDPRSAVVRYLEGPITDSIKPIAGPLRLLLTGASPADQVKLGVDKELDGIVAALAAAKQTGRIAITRLDDLTPDALDRALLAVKPHLFHFSGHGVWDERAGAGHLLLDNGRDQSAELADVKLAMLLRSRGVALVVLNACETALGGEAWGGLAQSLVLAGVPAVVAMQMPVSDAAAAAFAGTLYAALANQYPLEQAVILARQTTARQAEAVASPGEWLAPVLFMRTGGEHFWQQEAVELPQATLDRISIGAIHAVNVASGDQIIDQRGAEINVGSKPIYTGGGAYIAGNVTVGGDFVGRDKTVHGDEVRGDKITTGNMMLASRDIIIVHGDAPAEGSRFQANLRRATDIKERIRLDVAYPKTVHIQKTFDLAVAVRQPDAPALALQDLVKIISAEGAVYRSAKSDTVRYRIEVDAPDCEVRPEKYIIYLKTGNNSPINIFRITPKRKGKISILVNAFQDDESLAAQTRVLVTAKLSVGGDFVGRDKIERRGGDSGLDVSQAFTKLAASVALQTSAADVDKAIQCVQRMQQAFDRGDDEKIADCIGELADLVPDVKESLRQVFSYPALHERVGPVTKYALRRLS